MQNSEITYKVNPSEGRPMWVAYVGYERIARRTYAECAATVAARRAERAERA